MAPHHWTIRRGAALKATDSGFLDVLADWGKTFGK